LRTKKAPGNRRVPKGRGGEKSRAGKRLYIKVKRYIAEV
jgi:hypothetical protein